MHLNIEFKINVNYFLKNVQFIRINSRNKEIMSFKKRYILGYKKPKIVWGDFSLNFEKSYNIEYICIYNFKKALKKFFKFKFKKKKIWLFLFKNFPITKKSKNSRMGKGKGKFVRFCSRTLYNHNILEFSGFTIKEIVKVKRVLKKKVNIPTVIFSKFFYKKQYRYNYVNENFFFQNLRKK